MYSGAHPTSKHGFVQIVGVLDKYSVIHAVYTALVEHYRIQIVHTHSPFPVQSLYIHGCEILFQQRAICMQNIMMYALFTSGYQQLKKYASVTNC